MKLLNTTLTRGYTVNYATNTELNEVYGLFINPLFGQAVLPQQEAQKILAKCPESLSIVRDEQTSELVGFYSLVNLNTEGYNKLTQQQISGVELTESLVVAGEKDKAYLAGIASFGNRAKVATLCYAYRQGIAFQEVVSVPVSAFGLHWAEKVGCFPLKSDSAGLNKLYTWKKVA